MTFSAQRGESRLLRALSPPERARIEPFIEHVSLERRQVLHEIGEPIRYAVFPTDAVTSTLVLLPEGDSVEVGLMGAEGMVGLGLVYGQRIATTTVVVQIAGQGTRIPAEAFMREVVQHGGELNRLILRYANAFSAMVAQVAGCNASHSIEQRMARWLLLVHDRVGQDTFNITHEFLALMLGVRRASVTQAASTLRAAGAIEYHSGTVQVLDRNELREAACGCYAVMFDLGEWIFAQNGTPSTLGD